ncbi:MAG: hypothetical protein M3Y13_15895 [Armatimonadota bacterium]|nr:hypothetical protein [Armatimonadota bacterium]
MPVIPRGVRPPKNPYRAEVTVREVVYRRPLSQRIGLGVFCLFFVGMFAAALGIALLGLGLIFVPGMHMRENPALALMMGAACVMFVSFIVSMLAMAGPRELRVSLRDRTYRYRLSAPMRRPFPTGPFGKANRDETGLPWRTIEYTGPLEDMAGIQMEEATRKSATSYLLFLRWTDPNRPSLRVGHALKEDKVRALQAQAADDFGVPLLPDEVD